jgi:EAL domain-containing protein (putative c-di-GMP-specific phosphodiesterase class I)
MSHPFTLSGNQVQVTASIGVATAAAGDTADDLLRNADVAMYAAKRRGKGRSETYESRMYADVRHRLEMEAALRAAIDAGELTLHYQPIVQLSTGAIYGVEALVRWEHQTYGHLLPQHFIPLAEETGLIVKLGSWVMDEACRQVQAWRLAFPGSPLSVSVNISSRQLQGPGIADALSDALASSGVDPSAIILEITESVLMQQTDSVLERLQTLKKRGVRLAIDDFGTGYCSLSYLQRFPLDIMKIDKAFIARMATNGNDAALASTIVALAATLKLFTVAEGVEDADQRQQLLALGCDHGQGFLFAQPVPASAIADLLLNGAAQPMARTRLEAAGV